MAFRRDVLIDLGGFDPAFHYFLDETDLNMRLARAGHATAIVPLAEVHHGYAENRMRSAARVPTDLFDIGASWAVFQRKHVPQSDRAAQWKSLRQEQRRRLLRHMQAGTLEPRDVPRLMKRLDRGYAEGVERRSGAVGLARHPLLPFQRFPATFRDSVMIVSRPAHTTTDRARALDETRAGRSVTLLILSPTALFHQLIYDQNGFWVQKGGLFGKTDRSERLFQIASRKKRAARETARIAPQRGFGRENSTKRP